jgi:uncharacterized membrane protein
MMIALIIALSIALYVTIGAATFRYGYRNNFLVYICRGVETCGELMAASIFWPVGLPWAVIAVCAKNFVQAERRRDEERREVARERERLEQVAKDLLKSEGIEI